jgi:Protein of unknown function (DUF2778)
MGGMVSKSRATARGTKERTPGSGVARHGRRLFGVAVVGAIGVSPFFVQSFIEPPTAVPSLEHGGPDRHLTRATAGEAAFLDRAFQDTVAQGTAFQDTVVQEAAFRETALLEPVSSLESKSFGFTSLGDAAPLMDGMPAGYALRSFGQPALRRFSLSPLASYSSIAASPPEPVAPSGPAEIVTGSIPPEPEAAPPLGPPASEQAALELAVPLPVPRPADASETAEEIPIPENPRGVETARPAPAEPDNRNFVQKLFGVQPPGAQTSGERSLAYAPPPARKETSTGQRSLLPSLFGSRTRAEPGTALYDISARTVYLPSGEKLEAHSGLGDKKDDPRHVNVRMHGPTPPHIYDLTEREKPFHGVAALRLNPVGGSGAIHGRVGLLAHSYLLGPGGDSNGCVSVKDYDRFLQAYRRGEIRRLVVVGSAS